MEGDEFEAFCRDVELTGLLEPIVTHKQMVLDGRNRLRACEATGTAPRFVDWGGRGGTPVAFVLSENLKRRHLTASQS